MIHKPAGAISANGESEVEPIGSYAVDDEPVLNIDDTTVYLSEINARAYMVRDQYVADYGEEPWNTKMDNGMTVGEYAKATMLDEIEREVILCNKADEYDVPALTDDEEKQCASKAEDYMASIGEDIAAQFSVEQSAVLAIYEKDAISMKVYNQILEDLSARLRQEDEYKDMEDSAFEQVLNDKFEEQYTQWKNDCVETKRWGAACHAQEQWAGIVFRNNYTIYLPANPIVQVEKPQRSRHACVLPAQSNPHPTRLV